MMLYEALKNSMNRDHTEELLKDLVKARKKKKKSHDSSNMPPGSPPHQPPPPPPPAGPSRTSGCPEAFGSSQTAASAEYKAWTMTDTRLRLSVSSTPEDLQMDDDMAPDAQAHSSDDEYIRNAHIPKVNLRQDWWKPLKEARSATPELAWSIPSSDVHVLKNNWASALASTYSPPPEDSLLAHNVKKPLPLGGPPGQVTIQSNFFFNKDLEYLRYGSKGSRPALSILKMKAAYYLDVGLEKMVPDQMWIEEECKYDIAAIVVRSHMRILCVVKIEVFSMYGYDYVKKLVLRRVDLNKHIIAERDFKYLYPSDFEDLYLLNLQGHLNHLPPKDKKILTTVVNLWTRHLVIRQRVKDFQLGIESYQTQLNLTKPRWDATSFEYKHDYTVIDSSRTATFRDKYEVQMIKRFNEIHKFSDGTLNQIDEALNYRVKEFKVNRMNPGLNTRFWKRKDVDRSNEFMFSIQKWLKTRSIFHNLESFVGGRVKQKEDGIFISQDKYVAKILKKFNFLSVKTASTPIETQKPLVKDEEAVDVDVHLYRFQVTPKTPHLQAVKRIFKYLKGQPKLGDKIQKTTDCKTCEKPVSQVEQIFQEELEKLKRQEKEANDAVRKETAHENQNANTNSTNLLNAVSTPISTVGPLIALNDDKPSYLDDPLMPRLQDIYVSPSEGIFTDSSYDDACV
nr:hypothetical protein [Tanacetum cinerariifolium]